MAEIKITIPDAQMPDVIEALAARGGYDTLHVPDGETKPTKQAFAKAQVVDFVKTVTRHYKAEVASKAAADAAYAEIDAGLDIT
jgi:hypothetical protein